jgi:integrase
MPEIRTVTLKNGDLRYKFTVDGGRDASGRRVQIKKTFERKREAVAELARITAESAQGSYVRPSRETLAAYLDGYLEGATRGLRASTAANYRIALQPAAERLGGRRLQSIAKSDIEALVSWMLASGRKRGGKPGTGLSPRSVRLTLGRLKAALDMAVEEGKLARNPAARVRTPELARSERPTWSEDQARAFLAEPDRLHAAWRLALYGLRRGEVLGLRWADIDFGAGTLTVRQSRISVSYGVRTEAPKSANGERCLPLEPALTSALRALRKVQAEDQLAAGPAYEPGGYIVADELGRPVHPEWFTDEFRRVAARADVPPIRLHDARHTACSLMEKAGVPVSVISKWAGHYSPAFTMATYVHATGDDLRTGADALSKICNPAVAEREA